MTPLGKQEEPSRWIHEFAAAEDRIFRTIAARLDLDAPYFGQFVIKSDPDSAPIVFRVGPRQIPDEQIVDWRRPTARLFYEGQLGSSVNFRQERANLGTSPQANSNTGMFIERHKLGTAARTLHHLWVDKVADNGQIHTFQLEREGDGTFVEPSAARPATQFGLPDIRALLTREQYALITSSRRRPVIIQGRAGSGKTSIALYRVAWLAAPDTENGEAPIEPSRVLIVMFNRALSAFVKKGLAPLQLEAAQLHTFHGWALNEIQRAYRGAIEPNPRSRVGADIAIAIKKQLGMLRAIEGFVARQAGALDSWLTEKLLPLRALDWVEKFKSINKPVVRKLVLLRAEVRAARDSEMGRDHKRLEMIQLVFERAIERMTLYKEELLKLLTDVDFLARYLPTTARHDLVTLAGYQSKLQSEGGTDRRLGPSIAFEDFALLLRLIHLKHGGFPDKDRDNEIRTYDHLVIDEAQDFGALELSVLLSSVQSRTGVTIVGDVNQKIIPEADFIGWDALAHELGLGGAEVMKLEITHRSTLPILRVADVIVGDREATGRAGPIPILTITENPAAMLDHVALLCTNAVSENSQSQICVVLREAPQAAHVRDELLARLPTMPVRLGHNKEFEFEPGVTVTNLRQVKGLEFDVVIVIDPNDASYPPTDQGRRWLYMVVTRAKDALFFVTSDGGQPTNMSKSGHGAAQGNAQHTAAPFGAAKASGTGPGTLLQQVIAAGVVRVDDRMDVAEVKFGAEDEEPF